MTKPVSGRLLNYGFATSALSTRLTYEIATEDIYCDVVEFGTIADTDAYRT